MATFTYRDLIDHLTDYAGGNAQLAGQRKVRSAIQAAYEELPRMRNWSFLYRQGRLQLNAPYSTGTVDYVHTGGTYERQLTLASGTWPTWAARGKIRISTTNYEVLERKSATVLQLDEVLTPQADVAAGTAYTIYQSQYVLPVDFWRMATDGLKLGTSRTIPSHVSVEDWNRQESLHSNSGSPLCYAVLGDPDYYGRYCVAFHPYPGTAEVCDFTYIRSLRPLVYTGHDPATDSAGTITTTASSAAIAGTGTAFDSGMVGSVLRIGNNAVDVPTGQYGDKRFRHERTIIAVASATALTVDSTINETLTASKYCVSDPIDIDPNIRKLLLRMVEQEYCVLNDRAKIELAASLRQQEFQSATAGDDKTYGVRYAMGGQNMSAYDRPAYHPWPTSDPG